jgi:hypothetical protein
MDMQGTNNTRHEDKMMTIESTSGNMTITNHFRQVRRCDDLVNQWGLSVQAPWQSGPTTEWYEKEVDRDFSRDMAIESFKRQAA